MIFTITFQLRYVGVFYKWFKIKILRAFLILESDFSLRERLASGGSDKNLLFVANSSSTGIQKSRTGKTAAQYLYSSILPIKYNHQL